MASFWRSHRYDRLRPVHDRAVRPRRPDEGDQDRAAEAGEDHRATWQVPPHGGSRPQHDLPVPRLGARDHRPARADHQDRAAAGHHPRQRDDGSRCGHLLRHRRSGARHLRGAEPPLGSRAAHAVGAAQRHRPARSRSHAGLARHDQHRNSAPRSTPPRSSGASR